MIDVKNVQNLAGEINDLLSIDFDNLQSFHDLSKWPVGESRIIGKTINTKIINDPYHQRFITQIPPLESFGSHWHDCSETCTVLSGILQDQKTSRTYEVNQQAVFSKGQKHTPWNPSAENWLYITVDFYK